MSVNCAWGEWSAYTGCTKTCGGGKHYRYRAILTHGENDGTACAGSDNVENQDCNTQTCSGSYDTIITEIYDQPLVYCLQLYQLSNLSSLTTYNIL